MLLKKIIVLCFLLPLVAVAAKPIKTTELEIPLPTPTPKEYISLYAKKYNAVEKQLLAVASCESRFNPKAVGDGGSARNIFQYHKGTFERFSDLLGEELDYNSYHDQAKLTAFIFAKYPKLKTHWTCWSMLYGV